MNISTQYKTFVIVTGVILGMSLVIPSFAGDYKASSWDRQILGTKRWVAVLESPDAIRDNETGLIWERSPHTRFSIDWESARQYCRSLKLAGRAGWRLPYFEELSSLVGGVRGLDIPEGHPFPSISGEFWSATSDSADTALIFRIPTVPDLDVFNFTKGKKNDQQVWCVRTGH